MSVKALNKKESRTGSDSREPGVERECCERQGKSEEMCKTLPKKDTRNGHPDDTKERERRDRRSRWDEGGSKSNRSRCRSRDRDRDTSSRHQKKQRRLKKRHRGRSSSTSSSMSSSRSRSRSSKARVRHRRRRQSSSYGSSDNSSDRNNHRYCSQYDSYKYQEPNNTVMIRSLASHLNEKDIREDLLQYEIPVKDVRVIRNHETGASRGFAFAEFHCVEDATRWIEIKKGLLILQDQFHSSLIYSVPKTEGNPFPTDWDCQICYATNFKRREFCYKCNAPKLDEEEAEFGEISSRPTSAIILSNLNTLTTEEGVLQAFQSKPGVASIPIKTVKIVREADTSISTGKCYVQANNVADATNLLSNLLMEMFEIDGRIVLAAYGKTVRHGGILPKSSNAAATALAAARWTNNTMQTPLTNVEVTGPPCAQIKTEADVENMASYYAKLYAKTTDEYSSYLRYYRQYYFQEMAKRRMSANSTVLNKPSQKSRGQHHLTLHQSLDPETVVAASGSQTSCNWFDKQNNSSNQDIGSMKSYQYDEASGYYFDVESGLYYDPEEQQFFPYYNQGVDHAAVSSPCNEVGDFRKEKKAEKHDKVKDAKLISREMEKWAKHLNQKKSRNMSAEDSSPVPASTSTLAIDPLILSTSLAKKGVCESGPVNNPRVCISPGSESFPAYTPAAQSGSNHRLSPLSVSADMQTQFKESKLVDESKLACLLCKRRFSSKDVLQKHLTMSDLHKSNLNAIFRVPESCITDSHTVQASESLYRDRAKERRDQFGYETDKDGSHNLLKSLYTQAMTDFKNRSKVEEFLNSSIKEDNIGNRMLQRMGWREGQGLGLNNQGGVDIIKAQYRAERLGLGIRVPETIDEKLDPQSRARRITLARYQELE